MATTETAIELAIIHHLAQIGHLTRQTVDQMLPRMEQYRLIAILVTAAESIMAGRVDAGVIRALDLVADHLDAALDAPPPSGPARFVPTA